MLILNKTGLVIQFDCSADLMIITPREASSFPVFYLLFFKLGGYRPKVCKAKLMNIMCL